MMLHAMVVVALRFSTDLRLGESSRQEYVKRSKEKVLLYGMQTFSVKALQALVILALDFMGSQNGGAGLNLLALIARSVAQLGLSAESSTPALPEHRSISTLRAPLLREPASWIEDEGRRRLFWLAYVLDRDATVATSLEFAINDEDIDRKLPCKEEFYARNIPVDTRWFRSPKRIDYSMNLPSNMGYFSYLIELKGMLSKIHRFLRRPVDISALSDVEKWQTTYRELAQGLTKWQLNLPTEFGTIARIPNMGEGSKPMPTGWILLQVTYHT